MSASGSTTKIHQLKVVVQGADPPIWRRLHVPATTTLADLHMVLQVAMGWEDCHLHQFHIAGKIYGIDDGEGWGPAPIDERRTRLDQLGRKGTRFTYEYDFGDSWEHDITVEAVLDADNGTTSPACVAGERACPPEDCGGVWGYEQLLAAIAYPDHDDHDHFLEWVGDEFDPARLDLAAINRALDPVRRRRTHTHAR